MIIAKKNQNKHFGNVSKHCIHFNSPAVNECYSIQGPEQPKNCPGAHNQYMT